MATKHMQVKSDRSTKMQGVRSRMQRILRQKLLSISLFTEENLQFTMTMLRHDPNNFLTGQFGPLALLQFASIIARI
jgi:hypothetical protein